MRLFRFSGIQVSVHWSWLIAGAYIIENRRENYSSLAWNVAEYVALFAIVLLHEFGHAFACRQVGGRADSIVLWPLGGVAYVAPPQRPGAQLWSIAAGPLVNVALIPVFYLLVQWSGAFGPWYILSNSDRFLRALFETNLVILLFNIFPVYPLDGGQMLRSVLWYGIGPIRSLKAATFIGFIGAGLFGLYALKQQDLWLGVMALFLFMNCRSGWLQAKAWSEYERTNGPISSPRNRP